MDVFSNGNMNTTHWSHTLLFTVYHSYNCYARPPQCHQQTNDNH